MYFSIFPCYTYMHCLKNSSEIPLRLAWWRPRFQNDPPWWSPWSWGKEKSHMWQYEVNREVVTEWWRSSRLETYGCSGRCEQIHCHSETATACPATTLFSSRKLSDIYAAGSPCKLLIDHLALWQKLASDDITHWINMTNILPSCFLRILWRQRLPLTALALGFLVVLKNPSHHQWWLNDEILAQSENA